MKHYKFTQIAEDAAAVGDVDLEPDVTYDQLRAALHVETNGPYESSLGNKCVVHFGGGRSNGQWLIEAGFLEPLNGGKTCKDTLQGTHPAIEIRVLKDYRGSLVGIHTTTPRAEWLAIISKRFPDAENVKPEDGSGVHFSRNWELSSSSSGLSLRDTNIIIVPAGTSR